MKKDANKKTTVFVKDSDCVRKGLAPTTPPPPPPKHKNSQSAESSMPSK